MYPQLLDKIIEKYTKDIYILTVEDDDGMDIQDVFRNRDKAIEEAIKWIPSEEDLLTLIDIPQYITLDWTVQRILDDIPLEGLELKEIVILIREKWKQDLIKKNCFVNIIIDVTFEIKKYEIKS